MTRFLAITLTGILLSMSVFLAHVWAEDGADYAPLPDDVVVFGGADPMPPAGPSGIAAFEGLPQCAFSTTDQKYCCAGAVTGITEASVTVAFAAAYICVDGDTSVPVKGFVDGLKPDPASGNLSFSKLCSAPIAAGVCPWPVFLAPVQLTVSVSPQATPNATTPPSPAVKLLQGYATAE